MIQINEIIGIIATTFAVAGVITNNRRLRLCYLLWLVSNGLTGGIHVHAGIWSLVVRDAIFFVLAIVGWFKWGRIDKKFTEEKAKEIATAVSAQRMLNNSLIEKLLYDAEQYRIVAKGLLGRELKLPRRP
ncbi:hypothetical protein LCGC14_0580880 [marine sediment metagenome]|uniref:Uncharacterized protein n=1 Tax=marine sediment metagenome TaxID=412755 RepID=A0A0F9U2Q5_9ZZZZ